MTITYRQLILIFATAILFTACGNTTSASKQVAKNADETVQIPTFSPDSAYRFVEEQLAFGARVPGSKAHTECLTYFQQKFEQFGAEVKVQEGYGTRYDGKRVDLYNVIARINPDAMRRVIVCAHWDCRPWADEEENSRHHNTPVMGANDGASGVGVIMELCRTMSTQLPEVGVDFILFDYEDSGTPTFHDGVHQENTWCLGSQYWARTLKNTSSKPMYGILLDMVGAPGAQFYQEQISLYYAPNIVDKIWNKAATLGYSQYFVPQMGGIVTDDHQYMNEIAGIPTANIIQYNPMSENGFGDYWHTLNDDMSNIDRNTLMVVGNTVLNIIYHE